MEAPVNTHASWLVGLLALVIGTVGTVGYRDRNRHREALAELREQLDELRTVRAAEAPPETSDAELAQVEATLGELQRRLARLESTSERRPAAAVETPAPEETVTEEVTAMPKPAGDAELDELRELLAGLKASSWDYAGPELQRFLELFKDGAALDRLIGELEEHVEANPGDVERRMELADVYVGRLMTLSGPEQGVWGGKAEAQWKEVTRLDDDHWGAHSSLGTNYSFYPTVMGKTGDAIHHLERAREIQRHRVAQPEQVQTYLYLSRLHGREGNAGEAAAVLREGLELHPGDTSLAEALAALDG
jgi:tetratricopeptide (TPR) repeat protein